MIKDPAQLERDLTAPRVKGKTQFDATVRVACVRGLIRSCPGFSERADSLFQTAFGGGNLSHQL